MQLVRIFTLYENGVGCTDDNKHQEMLLQRLKHHRKMLGKVVFIAKGV
jgi:hypothetical protein